MGILALANMVPQTGPESQWTAANFTSTRCFGLLALDHVVGKCSRLVEFGLTGVLGRLRTGLVGRDAPGSKFSDSLGQAECFRIRQASTWPTVAGGWEVGGGEGGG